LENFSDYTVLIVDDEEALRDSIAFDFNRKGFQVLTAENGRAAFELVKEKKIHLVISDIRMSGGDGMKLLDEIKRRDPLVPCVILITGFADVTEAECLSRGARQVISKPFDRKVLMKSALEAMGIG
jgi:DNA-binding NtrC family response regulator